MTDFASAGLDVFFCAEAGDFWASVSAGDISADLKDAAETSSSSAASEL